METKKIESTEKLEPIDRAKKRLPRMVRLMSKAHEIGKRCMEFVAGEQWEDKYKADREASKRPMITINKLDNFVNMVVNKNSQERSRIKAIPFEDADADHAKVVNGLIRHIQYSDKSDAGEAYSNAFFDLVSMGFGYVRVDTEYCDEMAVTEQEIVINPIDDPLSVYLDPKGKFAFVIKFIPKDEFEEEYGEHGPSGWDVNLSGDDPDDVMVVEYWEKTETDVTIYSIEIPEPIAPEIPVDDVEAAIAGIQGPVQQSPKGPITVTEEELQEYLALYPDIDTSINRKSKKIEVKQYLFAGDDVLEEKQWAGKYIPIVGCFARKFKTRSGEIFFKPLVFNALDPQIYYNFLKSQDAELMMMAPKSPWIGAEGQFDGHEDEWSNSNTSHIPYLQYKPVDIGGQLAPPPHRSGPPQVNVAFYNNMQMASDEIKSCIGMYDASLGATSNETSGKAILARSRQGDVSTHHFSAASNTMLRQVGLIIIDLRPKIYDTPRMIRILGDDMADEVVKINAPHIDQKTGKMVNYDMTAGKYDIKIDTGSSSITRRLDAAENLIQFAQAVPKAGELSAHIIAKNLDFEYADELSNLLRAALPQGLTDRAKQLEDGSNGGPTPEQLQMQKMQQALMGMNQQLQQTQQAAQNLAKENQVLKGKISQADVVMAQIKAQSEVRQEQIESAAQVEVARINNGYRSNPMPVPAVAPPGNRPPMAMAYPDGRV